MAPPALEQLGPYRIVRTLGEGGMGVVYEGMHSTIGRRVAIKVLHAEMAKAPNVASRFFNEARAVNLIQHPSIVSVSEFGQADDGTPYMVMEYLEGESLASRIGRMGRLPDGLSIIRQIASALAAAHDKGVIHRDLKPANIMIVPDPEAVGGERAKVLDFGVAKVGDAALSGELMHKTRTGTIMGTPAYMSPEQCRSATTVTDRSDVYSLGIIAYEMMAGAPPFNCDSVGEMLARHLYAPPPPLRDRAPATPPEIADLIHVMLSKGITDRPSMAVVAERLGARAVAAPQLPPAPQPQPAPTLPPSLQATQLSPVPQPAEVIAPRRLASPWRRRLLQLLTPAAILLLIVAVASQRRPRPQPEVRAQAPRREGPRVSWHVDSTPPAAQIIRVSDGAVLGLTPWSSEQAPSAGQVEILLRLAGYVDRRLQLDGAKDSLRDAVLEPLPPPLDPPAAPGDSGAPSAPAPPYPMGPLIPMGPPAPVQGAPHGAR